MKNFKFVASLASLGRLFHNFPALYTKLFFKYFVLGLGKPILVSQSLRLYFSE